MLYSTAHIIHLLSAIAFIGVVFFEVFILESVRKQLDPQLMTQVENSIITQAKRIMPWVVACIFISGGLLAYNHFTANNPPWNYARGQMLLLKIALAISVLVHFITAIRAAHGGCMDSNKFKFTHLSVFAHMVLIVILAKGIHYFHW